MYKLKVHPKLNSSNIYVSYDQILHLEIGVVDYITNNSYTLN